MPSPAFARAMAAIGKYVPNSLQPLWNHPAGPQTIFFWAPAFKWGIVIAGINDIRRPANTISIFQSSALAATGAIWSRYSLVIIPKNWSLFSVNVFVALTGSYQASRAIKYQYFDKSAKPEEPKSAVSEPAESVKAQ